MGKRSDKCHDLCVSETDTYLVIPGGIHSYCGHVRDTQSLGVCRGLQEAVSSLECVGRCRLFPLTFITDLPYKLIMLCLFDLTSLSFISWQINNAGCMVHKRELNAEGLEKNFATNTMGETSLWCLRVPCCCICNSVLTLSLGVYILTQSLIPLLQKSRDPRVVRARTRTNTHTHTAHLHHVDSIMPLLSRL